VDEWEGERVDESDHSIPLSPHPSIPPSISKSATTVDEWMAQIEATPVQITGVRVETTETGLSVVLETAAGDLATPTTATVGNALIAEIPNAVLDLPEEEAFEAFDPAEGIALVSVTETTDGGVQVSITGADAPPIGEFTADSTGLVLSVLPSQEGLAQSEDDTIQITVTGEQEDSYYVPRATTGTRIDAPLRDIPQSIQVIPRQVLEDAQVVRLNEVADFVSGVQASPGYGGLSSNEVFIRGFRQGTSLRNGFRDFGFLSPRDVANIEQIEVLKGPASVLYGAFEPGGIVNTITEQPQFESAYELGMTVGSDSFYRPTVDLTGPLNEDRSLRYRLNLAYENAGSFRDFTDSESIFVAPTLAWDISDRTRLTTELEYQNYEYTFDRGFRPEPEFLDLPISRFLGEPDFNNANVNAFRGGYILEHDFSDNWQFRQGLSVTLAENDVREVNLRPLEADRRTLPRRASRSDESQQNYQLQNEFIGEFQTGSIDHQLLLGLDLSRLFFAYDFFSASLDSIDILDPVYGAQPGTFSPNFAEEYGNNTLGLYVQDLIEVAPNLKILLGGRLDWSDIFYRDRFTNTTNNSFSEVAFSPRAGIVYQPFDRTSLYFNWSRSFNPQFFGRSRTDEPFEPERGQQFEIGVKQEFLEGRLAASLALFDITKSNVLTADPVDPLFSIQTGEQTSRGVELDVIGEILPGWNILANYAYIDAFVSEDNMLPEGDRLVGIPEHSASLWTTYELQEGNLQGLGFGLGVVFVGERQGRLPNNDFTLPSYTRVDARVSYQRDNYELGLNIKNLFDIRSYETQGFFLVPQEPLTVLGTVSVTF
jgi:iron complex outermembrane receptor protein